MCSMTEPRPGVPRERQLHKAINGEAVVVIDQLVKEFGKLRAVDNLSLSIDAGETYGLIGPNGSGKTTLIRMLVGLIRPASGTIHVLNERVPSARVAPHIGYMTQLNALYLDLTARENMQFFCDIYGVRGKQQKQRIEEMLEREEIADRANEVVGNISDGMSASLSLDIAQVPLPLIFILPYATDFSDP